MWDDQWLIRNSRDLPGDVDYWPYTPGFEAFARRYREASKHEVSERAVFRRMVYLRKRRAEREGLRTYLPKSDKRLPDVPGPNIEETELLVKLYDDQPHTIDRLAYTAEFEKLFKTFKRTTGSNKSRYVVWRHLRRLARKGYFHNKTEKAKLKGFDLQW